MVARAEFADIDDVGVIAIALRIDRHLQPIAQAVLVAVDLLPEIEDAVGIRVGKVKLDDEVSSLDRVRSHERAVETDRCVRLRISIRERWLPVRGLARDEAPVPTCLIIPQSADPVTARGNRLRQTADEVVLLLRSQSCEVAAERRRVRASRFESETILGEEIPVMRVSARSPLGRARGGAARSPREVARVWSSIRVEVGRATLHDCAKVAHSIAVAIRLRRVRVIGAVVGRVQNAVTISVLRSSRSRNKQGQKECHTDWRNEYTRQRTSHS